MGDYSLLRAVAGQVLTIVGIDGGRGVRLRLASMGIREGARISLTRRPGAGPVVIEIGNGRIAIGSGVARKIRVAAHAIPPFCDAQQKAVSLTENGLKYS